ncbi:MAG: DUF4198 domain-containing protein [Bryobacterales bacterium]|nr:DUF4198 domain-containing protein [Bryobacterales bacterium]
MRTTIHTLLLAAFASAVALCHYTWVAPTAALEVGTPSIIQISHGHKFPVSEEAINAAQVDVYVLAPSGAKTKLVATKAAGSVTAPFQAKEAGLHRIVMVQDRGITSRTPQGVKQGGRDRNPSATQASRTFRTAVSYAGAGKAAKPVGVELELVGERTATGWQVQLLKNGKPAGGVAIEVFLPGAAKTAEAGRTGADGKLNWQTPAGSKGPALFSAMFKDPAPAGASYDAVNYETSLYVNW